MRKTQLCCLLVGFFACLPIGSAMTMTYTAGIDDNFAPPSETASPSANVLAAITDLLGTPRITDFDLTAGLNGGLSNHWVAHTFSGLPAGITGATLELRLRAGDDPVVWDDDFRLGFFDQPTDSLRPTDPTFAVAYWQPLGYRNNTTVGLANPAADWLTGDVALLVLDLSALPLAAGGTTDLIADLNTFRLLDVMVSDETAVDFMRLTIQAVPEPGTLALLGLSLAGLAASRRRKQTSSSTGPRR